MFKIAVIFGFLVFAWNAFADPQIECHPYLIADTSFSMVVADEPTHMRIDVSAHHFAGTRCHIEDGFAGVRFLKSTDACWAIVSGAAPDARRTIEFAINLKQVPLPDELGDGFVYLGKINQVDQKPFEPDRLICKVAPPILKLCQN